MTTTETPVPPQTQPQVQPRRQPYSTGLDKNAANFVALSPLSYIERSAAVYPDRTALDRKSVV